MKLGHLCRCVAVTLLLTLVGGVAMAADLVGTYRAEGAAADGAAYAGQVGVQPYGKGVALAWSLDGGARYRGLGLQLGDALGAVYWPEGERFEGLGIVVYRIEGGRMNGIWMPEGSAKTPPGREDLVGPASLEGRFEIVLGENPGGHSHYRGHVIVERRGDIHHFHWYTPTDSYVGNGVRIGDVMVVGYALGRAPGTVAYCIQGGELDGRWSYGEDTRVGRETLVRQPRPAESPAGGRAAGCRPTIALEQTPGGSPPGWAGAPPAGVAAR